MTTLAAIDAYRLLAAEYTSAPNPLLSLNRRTLPGLFPHLEGKVVIDVAAGTGYWAEWCATKGARAVACDFCLEMLVQARAPAVLANLLQLPFGAGADVVVCSFGLGYAPGCMNELARIVKPGGSVIASDVHPVAIANGWTRSFRVNGQRVEVAHEPYSIADLWTPELDLETLQEPRFGEPERAIFEGAGKLDDYAASHPAIFAARWRRV